MTFAQEMQDMATELLTEFDERPENSKLTLIVQGGKTFNPVTGEYEFASDAEYKMTGVQKTVSASMVDGTTIQQGDVFLTVSVDMVDASGSAVSVTPTVKDKVLIDGVQWSITDTPHADYTGSGTIICYKMQVRK